MAAPRRRCLATFTVGPVSTFTTQVLMTLLESHATQLLVTSSGVEREYRSMGLDPEHLSLIAPAVDPSAVGRRDRAALRRRWEVDESTLVIGLLSEPVRWADVRTAMNVVIRIVLTGRRAKMVVHPGATRRVEAERSAAEVGYGHLLIVDDDLAEPWRIAAGLDAGLLMGGELNAVDLSDTGSPFAVFTGGGRRLRPMPGIMPMLWTMAAGVPVIAETSDAVRDVVEEGRSGLLVEQHDVSAASERLMRIHDDPTIAGRIGASAREMVEQRFRVDDFCLRLRDAYDCALEARPVVRPVPDEAFEFVR
jgi:hypothetical protein